MIPGTTFVRNHSPLAIKVAALAAQRERTRRLNEITEFVSAAAKERLGRGANEFAKPLGKHSVKDVIRATARHLGHDYDSVAGSYRGHEIAYARHIAMYLSVLLTDRSLNRVGVVFDRDHSTILHGSVKISDLVARNSGWARQDALAIRLMLADTYTADPYYFGA